MRFKRSPHGRLSAAVALTVVLVALTVIPLVAAMAEPIPGETLIETISVPSNLVDGVVTTSTLQRGILYRFEVSGTFVWAGVNAGNISDAECSVSATDGDPVWQRNRYGAAPDLLDLQIERQNLDWHPYRADALGCNPLDHTYDGFLLPSISKQVRLNIRDTGYTDNSGALTVRIYRETTASVPGQVPIPSTPPFGLPYVPTILPTPPTVTPPTVTAPTVTPPTVTVPPGPTLTPPTLTVPPLPTSSPLPIPTVTVPPLPTNSPLPIPTVTVPPFPTIPPITIPPFPTLTPPTIPPRPTPGDALNPVQTITLNSAGPGVASVSMAKGEVYRLEVSGTYVYSTVSSYLSIDKNDPTKQKYYPWAADAECSIGNANGLYLADLQWARNNYGSAPDNLDVYVGSTQIDWIPVGPGLQGCDQVGHLYTAIYRPAVTGSQTIRVNDPSPSDNSGNLTVKLYRLVSNAPATEEPLQTRYPVRKLV